MTLCEDCKSEIEECPLGQGSCIEICQSCSLNEVSDYIESQRQIAVRSFDD